MKHSFEHCEQYEDILEKLRSRLFFSIGKSEFSCKLFLRLFLVEDELQECRQIISKIFEEYSLSKKRFKTAYFFFSFFFLTTESDTYALLLRYKS